MLSNFNSTDDLKANVVHAENDILCDNSGGHLL